MGKEIPKVFCPSGPTGAPVVGGDSDQPLTRRFPNDPHASITSML